MMAKVFKTNQIQKQADFHSNDYHIKYLLRNCKLSFNTMDFICDKGV